ncbi:hypothetical protein OW716_10105, partial [Acidithiobacillus ferriphilus]|uniref:hypothetical protein n=1 Tax=Acidithiobacillus ferriphilus TaxID=1689834 RepID=UPI002DBC91BF
MALGLRKACSGYPAAMVSHEAPSGPSSDTRRTRHKLMRRAPRSRRRRTFILHLLDLSLEQQH